MVELADRSLAAVDTEAPPLRASLRVLMFQIRSQPKAERHEIFCVRDCTGLDRRQLISYNVVHRSALPWHDLRGIDAIVIGGSGDHSATCDYPFMPWLEDIVRQAVAEKTPIFGICWGHHFLARALGGRVVTEPAHEEVGTFDVELNEAGIEDPLFDGLPRRFSANLVHHDCVIERPPGFVELGLSQRCPNQAMRQVGAPIYGTQFHGEMTPKQLRHRLLMYQDEYLETEDQAQDVVEHLSETLEARSLLRRFLELYT